MDLDKGLGRSGGFIQYRPPFEVVPKRRKREEVDDSRSYEVISAVALRKRIHALLNKVNASNINSILHELLSENLVPGRGMFAPCCLKAQRASPLFTHVFAAVVAVANTKKPEVGELVLKRIVARFKRSFRRNDKPALLAAAKFVAHLVNQRVAHEVVALELLNLLLDQPTDDSVEVAVGFVKECGATLQRVALQGLIDICERLGEILDDGEIHMRVQVMIEDLFAICESRFQGFEAVVKELDLVEQEHQITHLLPLEAVLDPEDEESEDEEEEMKRLQLEDEIETKLLPLRCKIFLTIERNVDPGKAENELLKIKLEPGQEMEICDMLLTCCIVAWEYLPYHGLLGERLCMINRVYQKCFGECFVKQYSTIDKLNTHEQRNVTHFFAHLVGTPALPLQAFGDIRLPLEDAIFSLRIYMKMLFQELPEQFWELNERLRDPGTQEPYDGSFPEENWSNAWLASAIQLSTSIGPADLTDAFRERLVLHASS